MAAFSFLGRSVRRGCCLPTIENEQLTDDALVGIALLLAHSLRVDVERGLNVRVPQKFLLHLDVSSVRSQQR